MLVLRRALAADPGAEWRALARRLIGAVDGERLVAALLAHSYASVEGMPVVPVPVPGLWQVTDALVTVSLPEKVTTTV